MKKALILTMLCLFLFQAVGMTAYYDTVSFQPDSNNAKSIAVTLSGTPGTVTTVTLPDTAIGFRVYPNSQNIRFAVNSTVAAVGASSTTPIAATALTNGGIAKSDQWEVRLLPDGPSRTLTMSSLSASVVVDLEVF